MHEVIMPKLGLTMESGIVEKWRKKEGEKVEAGEILFDIMTDKVSLEVEAGNSGYLRKVFVGDGTEVPVTQVIAYIGELDETVPEKPAGNIPEYKKGALSADAGNTPLVQEEAGIQEPVYQNPEVKISPLARNLAKELGIDYMKEKINGSGPGGRITNEDIIRFKENRELSSVGESVNTTIAEGKSSDAAGQGEGEIKVRSMTPLTGIRKVIAEKMTYSKQNIPHIIQTVVISADKLVDIRESIKNKADSEFGSHLTITDFIIKAAANVLSMQPVINSSLQNENHIIYDDINIAIGIATGAGLTIATIFNADRQGLFEIAKTRVRLIEKAKSNSLGLADVSNATFTISNLGMYGIRNFTAIINPPQGAILMVGEIYKDITEENGKAVFRKFMDISMAVDHRIIDGADSAIFLKRLKETIENPALLLI
ncbi:MAG: dihydrolipoamide acetyltransferase family protein [Candidatus Humimicrobiaceae bacterium]